MNMKKGQLYQELVSIRIKYKQNNIANVRYVEYYKC